MDVKEVCEVW